MNAKPTIAVACALALSGCASMGPAEITWQSLHAIDTHQTLEIARNPDCFREADPLTRALVGSHPSEAEAAAVMVAYSLGHYAVSRWLDVRADAAPYGSRWKDARALWHVVGIVTKGAVVLHNNSIGLGPVNRPECAP